MASSLRASGVMPLRGGKASTASMARVSESRHERRENMWRTPRDAPLLLVDLAALVRVEEVEGLLEARRVEQEHQVVVAAVADELYDRLRVERKW